MTKVATTVFLCDLCVVFLFQCFLEELRRKISCCIFRDKFEPLKKHYLIEFESCYKKLYSGTKLANIMKKYRGTLDFTRKVGR